MDPASRRAARAGWKVNVARSFADADAYDVDFWLGVPIDQRAELVGQLSRELYDLAHPDSPREPRLRRSVARVRRR